MKVLLIDDEAASRTAIKMLADWASSEVTHIFEAENGMEAMNVMSREQPDIVFADMNMPQMDGPAFLQAMRETYPDVAVVIASGYDRFDYAMQAIEAGAVSYLLKPIDPEQLNDALRKAVVFVRNADARRDLDKTEDGSVRALIEKVLWRRETRLTRREEELLRDTFCAGRVNAVCALRLGGMKRALAKYNEDLTLVNATLGAWMEKLCREYGAGFYLPCAEMPHEATLFLSVQGIAPRELIGRICVGLREQFRVSVLAGVSDFVGDAGAIVETAARARAVLTQINLFETPDQAVFFETTPEQAIRMSTLDMMPLYRRAVSTKNASAFLNILNVAFQPLREKGVFSLAQADKCVAQQINMMSELLYGEGISDDVLFAASVGPAHFSSYDYTTFEGFFIEMQRLLDATAAALSAKLHWEKTIDIKLIKNYIDKNSHRDLRVQAIADGFFVSREYLTKLFSKQYGISMHGYIESVRMEEARKLLAQPDMRVQDVAQLMGFWDANYLSKKFRKYFGISPSQYQAGEAVVPSAVHKERP